MALAKPTAGRQARTWNLRRVITAITLGVWVIGGLTVIAYGFWGLRSYQNAQEEDRLKTQLATLERDLRIARNGATARETSPAAREALARAAALEATFFLPTDSIRITDQVTQLARRIGVTLNSVQVGTGRAERVGQVQLTALPVNLSARGSLERLDDFFDALQARAIPWLIVNQAQIDRASPEAAALSVNAAVYTLPGAEPRTMPPRLTGTLDGSAGTVVARPGEADRVLLSFTVRSEMEGDDALRALLIRMPSTGPATELRLYAEASGDAQLQPWADLLVAKADPAPEVLLAPAKPFRFAPHTEQRFYVAVVVADSATPGALIEAAVPPNGAVFTSASWPAGKSAVSAEAFIPLPPSIVPLQINTRAGEPVVIRLPGTGSVDSAVRARIVEGPRDGTIVGPPLLAVYIPNAGFVGYDRFTYVVNDGFEDSGEAIVSIYVSPAQ